MNSAQGKVFGWTDGKARKVVAAKSIAEVMRITGMTRYQLALCCTQTRNPQELEVALSEPGTVFRRALNDRHGEYQRV